MCIMTDKILDTIMYINHLLLLLLKQIGQITSSTGRDTMCLTIHKIDVDYLQNQQKCIIS